MPSFAPEFGMEEREFTRRAVSLAAYALSSSALQFPLGDLSAEQRAVFPSPVSQQLLVAEAATAMRGAASAAMVVDQRIGVALTNHAASLYWAAGHFYGAFLWGLLEVQDVRVFEVAGDLAERGLRGATSFPAALVPEQLAYLATGVLLTGQSGIAAQLFSLVPQTTVLGPYGLPVTLARSALDQSKGGALEVGQHLISSFEASQRALEHQSRQRRLLPWQVGMPPDSVLLLATLLRRSGLAAADLMSTGPYASALLGAALATTPLELQSTGDVPIQDLLSSWLEQGHG
jgi:hypothetical protein